MLVLAAPQRRPRPQIVGGKVPGPETLFALPRSRWFRDAGCPAEFARSLRPHRGWLPDRSRREATNNSVPRGALPAFRWTLVVREPKLVRPHSQCDPQSIPFG